jgi:FkbM family methyltransferase
MKNFIKHLFRSIGYELVPYGVAGSNRRPICNLKAFLQDIRARSFRPKLILDVGANRGDWTRMTKDIFPEARFLLVEPQVEMKNSLNDLCSEFEDISWVEAGAGAKEGKLVQTIWDDLAGSSFLPDVDKNLLQSGKQREVDIVTIDSLLVKFNLNIPDLVKLDIQGFELEALRGANSLFGNTELFIIEASLFSFDDVPGMPIFREVIEFMGERGYEIYDIVGYLRRPFDGALGQVDIAFVKREGILRQSNKW